MVWSVARLSKLIQSIQVGGQSDIRPNRCTIYALITVYMAKFMTYSLFSILSVAYIVTGVCTYVPIAKADYVLVWISDFSTSLLTGYLSFRFSRDQ